MKNEQLKYAIERLKNLGGDVADCLSGSLPHDSLTFRGSLLHEVWECAHVLLRNAEQQELEGSAK